MAAEGGGAAAAAVAPPAERPLFRFGLLADVQHGDLDDGASFHGTPRYYRHALEATRRAVADFRAADVAFALHLGDLCDLANARQGAAAAEAAFAAAHAAFAPLGAAPVLHCSANHDLFCAAAIDPAAPRRALNARLGIDALKAAGAALGGAPAERASSSSHPAAEGLADGGDPAGGDHSYYSFRHPAAPGWRFLVLDGYEVSVLGWEAGHPLRAEAEAILAANNPNASWGSTDGLAGAARRFVDRSGAASAPQLRWLDAQLAAAGAAAERVVVASHLPLHPETAPPACLLWNYDAVLEVLGRHGGVVAATLAGHAHKVSSAASLSCQSKQKTP
jgi:manganese-dependent ADP-ribose/CDP-alcohol diphosphatase